MQAALALGEQRDVRAVEALIKALKDEDTNVRYHAIEALGKLKAVDAVDALAEIAESRDFFLAFAALDALAKIGDARIAPRIVPLLEDELLREPAINLLGQLGDESAVAPLTALLNTPTAPTDSIADALATLSDRYEEQYGEGALYRGSNQPRNLAHRRSESARRVGDARQRKLALDCVGPWLAQTIRRGPRAHAIDGTHRSA